MGRLMVAPKRPERMGGDAQSGSQTTWMSHESAENHPAVGMLFFDQTHAQRLALTVSLKDGSTLASAARAAAMP